MKQRWSRFVVTAAIVLLGTVYAIAWLAPSVGLYHDDGIYAVTAKALAEGHGYRIVSLPREIDQTKYPFLFPAALSVVWRLWPDFPNNVIALKALPLLCALAWFLLSYRLMLRLGAGKQHALWSVLLAAASPLVIFLSTNLMSESMFGALFMGALIAADSVERSESSEMAWVAGLLAGLDFLTRTIGASLLLAIPLAFAIQRRYSALWRFCLAGMPLACIWPMWVRLHPQVNGHSQFYYSAENYSSWNILTNYTLHEKITILLKNILLSLHSPATLLDLPSSPWMALIVLLILISAFAAKIPTLSSVHLSLAAYIVVFLCWAWPPSRFAAVILPMLLFIIGETCVRLGRHLAIRPFAIIAAGSLFCFVLAGDLGRIPATVSDGQFGFGHRPTDSWPELTKVFSWVRGNTAAKSVLLTNLDPSFYLYTERKATRDFIPDARKLFYDSEAPTSDSLGSLTEIIRGTPADFLIVTPDEGFAEAPVLRRNLKRFEEENAGALDLVERPGSNPDYRIYRIRRPK